MKTYAFVFTPITPTIHLRLRSADHVPVMEKYLQSHSEQLEAAIAYAIAAYVEKIIPGIKAEIGAPE